MQKDAALVQVAPTCYRKTWLQATVRLITRGMKQVVLALSSPTGLNSNNGYVLKRTNKIT